MNSYSDRQANESVVNKMKNFSSFEHFIEDIVKTQSNTKTNIYLFLDFLMQRKTEAAALREKEAMQSNKNHHQRIYHSNCTLPTRSTGMRLIRSVVCVLR